MTEYIPLRFTDYEIIITDPFVSPWGILHNDTTTPIRIDNMEWKTATHYIYASVLPKEWTSIIQGFPETSMLKDYVEQEFHKINYHFDEDKVYDAIYNVVNAKLQTYQRCTDLLAQLQTQRITIKDHHPFIGEFITDKTSQLLNSIVQSGTLQSSDFELLDYRQLFPQIDIYKWIKNHRLPFLLDSIAVIYQYLSIPIYSYTLKSVLDSISIPCKPNNVIISYYPELFFKMVQQSGLGLLQDYENVYLLWVSISETIYMYEQSDKSLTFYMDNVPEQFSNNDLYIVVRNLLHLLYQQSNSIKKYATISDKELYTLQDLLRIKPIPPIDTFETTEEEDIFIVHISSNLKSLFNMSKLSDNLSISKKIYYIIQYIQMNMNNLPLKNKSIINYFL